MKNQQRRNAGFTLIELMIVVAIVAILAAIAIPSLIQARISGNEAAAITSMKTIGTSSEQYFFRFGTYPANLNELLTTNYIDDALGAGTKSGYDFFFAGGVGVFVCLGNPRDPGGTGERYFFNDQSGVIRFNTAGVAGAGDAPLQ